jgi:nitrite reductase/ring-hydroxylating ferredoxin subunit
MPDEPRRDREDQPSKFIVGRAKDVPEGTRLIIDVNGRSVGIFNIEGEFYALLNRCPHKGAELCRGDVVGLVESDRPGDIRFDQNIWLIACPWHGWEYDVKTGQSWLNPQRSRVRPYGIRVESGDVVAQELEDGSTDMSGWPDGELIDSTTRRVKGPYIAGVFPITVEDDYLVVSMRAAIAPKDDRGKG